MKGIIFDYKFIGINDTALSQAPPNSIQFGGTMWHLLSCTITADHVYDPIFLSKVNISDAYMCKWLCPEYPPLLSFFVPPHPDDPNTLIVFHLSFAICYVESAQIFCCALETDK